MNIFSAMKSTFFLAISLLCSITIFSQPNLSVWQVDHLSDEPIIAHSGDSHGATLWPCGYEYYILHREDNDEQIILHILNDGDEDLILNPNLSSNTSEFSMDLLGLAGEITVGPNQELQVIINYYPNEIYTGEGAVLQMNSNDSNSSTCNISFGVGDGGPCNTTLDASLISEPILNASGNYNTTLEICFDYNSLDRRITGLDLKLNGGNDDFISVTPSMLPGNNGSPMDQIFGLPNDRLRFRITDFTKSWLSDDYCIELDIVMQTQVGFIEIYMDGSTDTDDCFAEAIVEFGILGPLECEGLGNTDPVGGFAGDEVVAPIDLTITGIPSGIVAGQIKICSSGDLEDDDEFYNVINKDDGSMFTFPQIPGAFDIDDCDQRCDYYPINDLAAIIADGEIELTLTPDEDEISDRCVDNNVYVSLEYCIQMEPVPTMGEWGIMSLGLLLLIFGVTSIKQKSLSIAE